MPKPSSKIFCAILWTMAILIPLLALAGILIPWANQLASLDRRIETGEEQRVRYRRLVNTLPRLKEELASVRGNDAFKEFYFKAPTPALAGAQLQSQVQEIVTAAKGRLISTQLLPAEKDQDPPSVRVRTQIQGTTETLLDVLHQLEQARPFLFVEQVSVRSSARPQLPAQDARSRLARRMPTNPAGELTVRLDIFGFALAGDGS
ncbi:type II secretion system protein GspM [Thiocystis violascens]|uniref:General secretion pathway protein M n=1 Tax=Thiocystis violascens (strain ATCC 17096 / DSM 198 / 6111) TaxID=765911 RepID=I3YCR0_THIV6|nr:type II secretion system protein GspM [Thiocystis violascens]AFL74778.1 General secretion pathway protein M [Thiocystis violascens DSM 198]